MRIVFDTSIIVEIDRHNERVIRLLKNLVEREEELIISTVTVAEILTGSNLMRDMQTAMLKAKEILNQFSWRDVDGEVAQTAAKLFSYLLIEKRSVEYPDVLIAATFLIEHADALITLNKKDFVVFPNLKGRVFDPEEFANIK